VTPSATRAVFVVGVLRIVHQQVGALGEAEAVDPVSRLVTEVTERGGFVIRHERERPSVLLEPETHCRSGMLDVHRDDRRRSDLPRA
jgi:hypothetical protein